MKNYFVRSLKNPILKPTPKHDWESLKIYNPGAIYDRGKYHLFYRAVGGGEDWHSSIGHAESNDGESFIKEEKPILDRENSSELRGLEDPRIIKIGETYYMAYAAFDGIEPKLNIATSHDLIHWEKQGPAFSDFHFIKSGGYRVRWENGKPVVNTIPKGNDERSKSGGIFPEKINGKYWMLFNENLIWMANSDDCLHWHFIKEPFIRAREGDYFDNTFVEMGPPPIRTERGWLILYHGIDDSIFYRLGFLLLDLNNPTKIIYRSDRPIFWPQEEYELTGLVDYLPGGLRSLMLLNDAEMKAFIGDAREKGIMPKVAFCCGAVLLGDSLRIYYGAGDTYICTATAKLSDILDTVK